jgi:hypothetical protein
MPLALSPTSSRMIEFFRGKEKGTRVPREDLMREFNLPWEKLTGPLNTARRVFRGWHLMGRQL